MEEQKRMNRERVPINRERFKRIIKEKGYSVRKLAKSSAIHKDESQIRKYLRAQGIPAFLFDNICKEIDVDPDFLSADFDERLEKNEPDPVKREQLLREMDVNDHPYRAKVFREIDIDLFYRLLLFQHDIPESTYDALGLKDKIQLSIDLERAISSVLTKWFPFDQRGATKRVYTIEKDENGVEYIFGRIAD